MRKNAAEGVMKKRDKFTIFFFNCISLAALFCNIHIFCFLQTVVRFLVVMQIGQKFTPKAPVENMFYSRSRYMLTTLGPQNYKNNFKKGLLTDSTLPLLTDSVVRDVKIQSGLRLLIDRVCGDRSFDTWYMPWKKVGLW